MDCGETMVMNDTYRHLGSKHPITYKKFKQQQAARQLENKQKKAKKNEKKNEKKKTQVKLSINKKSN